MKRFLSIDWDYFIDATAVQRLTLFPDGGNENISYDIQDFIWNSRYLDPELKKIGLFKKDYFTISQVLSRFCEKYVSTLVANPHREVLCTISHRWIYDFVMQRTDPNEEFELYNIDFHHDMYCYKVAGQDVNCGNWVNCLSEQRPNMKYHWVKREDSDDEVIGGDKVTCPTHGIEDIEDLDFDYLFICRSDCWSPPHLDKFFALLWGEVQRFCPVEVEKRAMKCREVAELSEPEKKYGLEIALAKDMRKYPNATCANCGAILPEGSPSIFCSKCNEG